MKNIAIAGATGAVGTAFIDLLEARDFPLASLRLLASERSAGKQILFKGEPLTVEALTPDSFEGIDVAFFAIGGEQSLEFVPHAVKAGAVVVDNSSAFRLRDDVPLVVPEANPESVKQHQGIIANPNCSTIQMVVALAPLHRAAQLTRIIVSTYQAVSGSGQAAIHELREQLHAFANGQPLVPSFYPVPIGLNVLPHIDVFMGNGYTKEEMKMVLETQKILNLPDLPISATCVRVPVMRAHSEAIQIETQKKLTVDDARRVLSEAPGIVVQDVREPGGYPTPMDVAETQKTFVGRLREDIASEKGLAMWVVADQLYKGAALNAIQIAELL